MQYCLIGEGASLPEEAFPGNAGMHGEGRARIVTLPT